MNSKIMLLVVLVVAGFATIAQAQLFRGQIFQRQSPVYQFQAYRTYTPRFGSRFAQRNCVQQYTRPQCQNQMSSQSVQRLPLAPKQMGKAQAPTLAGQLQAGNSDAANSDQPNVGEAPGIVDPLIAPASAEMEELPMIEDLIIDPEVQPAGGKVDPYLDGAKANTKATQESSVLEDDK